MIKLRYIGHHDLIDAPTADQWQWKRGEARDVAEDVAKSLLDRPDEFEKAEGRRAKAED
jgi:hypothetical protein